MANRKSVGGAQLPPAAKRDRRLDLAKAMVDHIRSPRGQLEIAERFIGWCRIRWEETSNPYWAWRAYLAARGVNQSIPDWVLECFDRAGRELDALTRNQTGVILQAGRVVKRYSRSIPKGHAVAPAIARALGFSRPAQSAGATVNGNGRRKHQRINPLDVWDASVELAASVHQRVSEGHKRVFAYEDVAAAHSVSRRTVERAWAKHGSLFS